MVVWKPDGGTLSDREDVGVEELHSGMNSFL